jgi:5'-nucleotidase
MTQFQIPKNLKNARILISNDDGFFAEGIKVLTKVAKQFCDDVWVVAPAAEQSGVSHSLTLHQPIRVNQLEEKSFSVTGTPTDCVLIAKNKILPSDKPIDLLLSGINHGDNMAEHVTYSGTIAATMEGALLGIPSIAFSRFIKDHNQPINWQSCEIAVRQVISQMLGFTWHQRSLISVNIPDCAPSELNGIKVVRQGNRNVGDSVEGRKDPRGRNYYWIGGTDYSGIVHAPETDCAVLAENYIAITPISLDLTNYNMLAQIDQHFEYEINEVSTNNNAARFI